MKKTINNGPFGEKNKKIWTKAGVSVKGPSHIAEGILCQDDFSVREMSGICVIAVSDGLGSVKNSHIGSKCACKAVTNAVRIWGRREGAPVDMLIKLINNIWKLLIFPLTPCECYATCLFGVALPSGRLVLGQLGDGLAAVESGGIRRKVEFARKGCFGNETVSLGSSKNIDDWQWIDTKYSEECMVMMCTDGVSEFIIENSEFELMSYIKDKAIKLDNTRKINSWLRFQLRNWEPQNPDDKTIAIMFKRKEDSSGIS